MESTDLLPEMRRRSSTVTWEGLLSASRAVAGLSKQPGVNTNIPLRSIILLRYHLYLAIRASVLVASTPQPDHRCRAFFAITSLRDKHHGFMATEEEEGRPSRPC